MPVQRAGAPGSGVPRADTAPGILVGNRFVKAYWTITGLVPGVPGRVSRLPDARSWCLGTIGLDHPTPDGVSRQA